MQGSRRRDSPNEAYVERSIDNRHHHVLVGSYQKTLYRHDGEPRNGGFGSSRDAASLGAAPSEMNWGFYERDMGLGVDTRQV